LSSPVATVVVPTLAADPALTDCLRSLGQQSRTDFEVIVVDNSGLGRARGLLPQGGSVRIIENTSNVGFGAAVNQGIEASQSDYVIALNDDAIASPDWLEALVRVAGQRPDAGMFASHVRLQSSELLDSAGMLICGDASSKQRGHGERAAAYCESCEALFPSGSAALYRRKMLEEIGGFDDDFFLYCEDTDLGLRARWAGWQGFYVADAVVEHRYSHSAGRASGLKAYLVERNRLYVAMKNFPLRMLPAVLFLSLQRYFWHLLYLLQGRGKAAEFAGEGGGPLLAWFVIRAHFAALTALPSLIAKRRRIRSGAKIGAAEFTRILRRHWITPRQVAAH
jgi:GT2 family glycosyltransferase